MALSIKAFTVKMMSYRYSFGPYKITVTVLNTDKISVIICISKLFKLLICILLFEVVFLFLFH